MDSMWKKIRQFDGFWYAGEKYVFLLFPRIHQRMPEVGTGGERDILLFLGNGLYFILLLCSNYKEPAVMTALAAAVTMGLMFYSLVRFTKREGEHWRSVYQKIMYFPVDRKKYLLAKVLPGAKVIALQLGLQCLAFVCRMMMGQAVAAETMILILLCIVVSGVWYFLGFLLLMVLGERALNLFPIPFVTGICLAYGLGSLWHLY